MRRIILMSLLMAALAATPCTDCWSQTMKLLCSDPLAKVLQNAPIDAPPCPELLIDGARGETVSAQVVLLPGDKPDTVSAKASSLIHEDGESAIPSSTVRLQWVRYMEITANTPAVPKDELVGVAPVSIPDPFWEDAERSVTPGSPQPLWIEIDVLADAHPGLYHGEVTVSGSSGKCSLPISMLIRSFALPKDRHQRVIQWWDFPGTGFQDLKPGTDGYWKHLRESCAFLRRHRQTDVRVDWGLIERRPDGQGWDATNFEKFAETALNAGMYAVQFTPMGGHTKSQLEPDSRTQIGDDNFGRLAAAEQVVQERGWKGRVFTSLADEPFTYNEETYRALLVRIREIAPSIGVIEAVETDDIGDLDIYVPKLSHLNLWWPHYEELKRRGEDVWFYTCCHPQGRYPNRFLDQPLVLARELHWISYLYDLDGYLHWGLNWFTANEDPYSEKGATPWGLPPGDGQVAYPGRNGFIGSLRLSAMRDGLQDFEYLWTLEDRLRQIKIRLGEDASWLDPRQRPTELCRRVVQSFYDHTRDPKVLLDTRAAIADEIEGLDARPLLVVQTLPPEGTVTPAGPIHINIRGLTTPGATVTVNGRVVIPQNLSAGGAFRDMVFITKEAPEIVFTAELDGITRTTTRTFEVVE